MNKNYKIYIDENKCKEYLDALIGTKTLAEHDKQIRAEVIEEIHSMCGAEKPCYANCNSCMFAYFENDFETTICKLEQLKEQKGE